MMLKGEHRWSNLVAIISVVGLFAVLILIRFFGDNIWWSVPILFGPRWVWAAALAGILPLAFKAPRRGLPWLALGIFFVCMIQDIRLGLGRFRSPGGARFRIMELNAARIGGDSSGSSRLVTLVRKSAPDLIVMVECNGELATRIGDDFPEYRIRNAGEICFISRDSVTSWNNRDSHEAWKEGGAATMLRAELQTRGGLLRVGVVHLATPRHALDSYFDLSGLPKMGPPTLANIAVRERESREARAWIIGSDSVPTVIAGDFNLPIESAIYRRHWGDLSNALSRVGIGLLHTKATRWWGVRIDHVLTAFGVLAAGASVESPVGSDHLPVIVDLVLPVR